MNWGAIGKIFSGGVNADSLLGQATASYSNTTGPQAPNSVDGKALDTIDKVNSENPDIPEYSNPDGYKAGDKLDPSVQADADKFLKSRGIEGAFGNWGLDNIYGEETAAALAQVEAIKAKEKEDAANAMLGSMEASRLKNKEGRGGVTAGEDGYMTPVYAAPKFNNRFS